MFTRLTGALQHSVWIFEFTATQKAKIHMALRSEQVYHRDSMCIPEHVWGANSNLSCHGQLIQTTAMVLPAIVVNSNNVTLLLSDCFGRRSTIECSVSSVRVVILLL